MPAAAPAAAAPGGSMWLHWLLHPFTSWSQQQQQHTRQQQQQLRRAGSASAAAVAAPGASTTNLDAPAHEHHQQQQQRPSPDQQQPPLPPPPPPPTHLVVMVNGLFGRPSDWDVAVEALRPALPPDTLLHASRANQRLDTYDGIDVCGQRLADEVRGVVAEHASLRRVSVVAHSMGGLIARYALGALYNPATGAVCGLKPCHFVSLATPNCGCDAEGVAQVPFIGWVGGLPLLGGQLLRLLRDVSAPVAGLIFRATGRQFFLMDGGGGGFNGGAGDGGTVQPPPPQEQQHQQQAPSPGDALAATADAAAAAADASPPPPPSTALLPLLVQMTQDCPDRGLFFFSALAAFQSRTCLANTDGDHLVGHANSSLRALDALPPLPAGVKAGAKGVVLEDAVSAGFYAPAWRRAARAWASLRAGEGEGDEGGAAPRLQGGGPEEEQARALVKQLGEEALAVADAAARAPYAASRQWTAADIAAWHELRRLQGQQGGGGAAAPVHWEPAAAAEGDGGAAAQGFAGASAGSDAQLLQLDAESLRRAADDAADALAAGGGGGGGGATRTRAAAPPPLSASAAADAEADLARGLATTPSRPSSPSASAAAAAAPAEAEAEAGGSAAAPALSPRAAADAVAADVAALAADVRDAGSRAALVGHMLRRLQALPWRRIDVCFAGARFPLGLSHNNIQVTRRWANFEGVQVPRFLATQLAAMDALVVAAAAAAATEADGKD